MTAAALGWGVVLFSREILFKLQRIMLLTFVAASLFLYFLGSLGNDITNDSMKHHYFMEVSTSTKWLLSYAFVVGSAGRL